MLKKITFGSIAFILALFLIGTALAKDKKEITMCTSIAFISTTEPMNCSGHFNGKTTMMQLSEKGWELKTDIARGNNFILVFQR